jgi:UDP-hydrolysing UDP-N-acetyl-D-glucosamine 2-epimerase
MTKLAVFTSNRSEYGLLRPLLRRVLADPRFDLALVVAGAHLRPEHGDTKRFIVGDQIPIATELDYLEPSDDPAAIARSMARLLAMFGEWASSARPEVLVILGDRFELLPVASAALVLHLPVAHIAGGDVTEGAFDDQVRHAVTKLSHLHFPATAQAHANLLALGEEPWRICRAGEPGLDEAISATPIARDALFAELGLDPSRPVGGVTFHAETIANQISAPVVVEILEGLVARTDLQLLVTAANPDEGGNAINASVRELAARTPRVRFRPSLGQERYYSLLHWADVLVGNSSSGLIEAHSFGVPVVDVGDRQRGRVANANVLRARAEVSAVIEAVERARSEEHRRSYRGLPNVYGDGRACERIVEVLASVDRSRLLAKRHVTHAT